MKAFMLAAAVCFPVLAAADTTATDVSNSKVAVAGFRATGVDEILVDNLTETFTTEAGKVPGFKVIGQSEIKDLVGYQAQQNMLGCDDAACMSDLAGALGVDMLIAGSVGKVGDTFVVNVRIIDVKKAETKHRVGANIAGRADALLPYIRLAAWQLLGVRPPDDVVAANDKAQAAAPPVEQPKPEPKPEVAAAPAPTTPPAPAEQGVSGLLVAKRISNAIAGLGIIGGGACAGLWFFKDQEIKDARVAKEGDVRQRDDYKKYGIIAGGIGGVGLIASIIFAAMLPPPAKAMLTPTADGVAFAF
jgi:TolB-like protein